MASPIVPISSPVLPESIRPAGQAGQASGAFHDVLSNAISKMDNIGQNASSTVDRFLTGEGEELHTTILAVQQAELSFDLFMQARNKLVSAYQEIMRMQV